MDSFRGARELESSGSSGVGHLRIVGSAPHRFSAKARGRLHRSAGGPADAGHKQAVLPRPGGGLNDILRLLVREEISIRDLRTILMLKRTRPRRTGHGTSERAGANGIEA